MGFSHWFVIKSQLALLLSCYEIADLQGFVGGKLALKTGFAFRFIYFLSSYFSYISELYPYLYQLAGTKK